MRFRRALSQVCLSALLPAAVYRDLSVSEMRSVNTAYTSRGYALFLFSYLSEGHNPQNADILLQAFHPVLPPSHHLLIGPWICDFIKPRASLTRWSANAPAPATSQFIPYVWPLYCHQSLWGLFRSLYNEFSNYLIPINDFRVKPDFS